MIPAVQDTTRSQLQVDHDHDEHGDPHPLNLKKRMTNSNCQGPLLCLTAQTRDPSALESIASCRRQDLKLTTTSLVDSTCEYLAGLLPATI